MAKAKKQLEIYEFGPGDTILGLDYSLNKYGICLIDYQGQVIFAEKRVNGLHNLSNTPTNQAKKMHNIGADLNTYVSYYRPKVCVFEGSAMNAQGAARMILSENLGAAKAMICHNDVFIDTIPPQTVKKFATGDGRAEKEELNFYFRLFTDSNEEDCDISDAYWIAQAFLELRTTAGCGEEPGEISV